MVISVPKAHTVKADLSLLRVITEDTPFYGSLSDSEPMFYLPYTYYVKVLGEHNEYVHVEIYGNGASAALDGYVPRHFLFYDGQTTLSPYLSLTITTATTAILYQDSQLITPIQYLFANRQLQYLGAKPTAFGNTYCVWYNNRIGYVKEADVYPFAIQNHPNELTFLTPEEPEQSPEENITSPDKDFFALKIIIVICLILAGVIALFVSLNKKPKSSVAIGFYDENDYD